MHCYFAFLAFCILRLLSPLDPYSPSLSISLRILSRSATQPTGRICRLPSMAPPVVALRHRHHYTPSRPALQSRHVLSLWYYGLCNFFQLVDRGLVIDRLCTDIKQLIWLMFSELMEDSGPLSVIFTYIQYFAMCYSGKVNYMAKFMYIILFCCKK